MEIYYNQQNYVIPMKYQIVRVQMERDMKQKQIPQDNLLGLHDKNEKEIYEGDILKSMQWNNIYLVKYIGTAFYLCRKGNKGFNKITTWNNAEKSEVIGNIYDNPELLGGEQINVLLFV